MRRGFFALTGDGAVVALRQSLFRLDLNGGAVHLLMPRPFDPALANRGVLATVPAEFGIPPQSTRRNPGRTM